MNTTPADDLDTLTNYLDDYLRDRFLAITHHTPPTTPAIDRAVDDYVTKHGLLLDPQNARDQCQTQSAAFIEALANHGVQARAVTGFLMMGNLVLIGHTAVLVDGQVWDWTVRQFGPQHPVPLVMPLTKWRATWQTIGARP